MRKILFYGDSLTAGYGLNNAAEESFPALIQQKINGEKLNYQVINAGLSGDTSGDGLSRIDYWLNSPIDIFVLELGINDIRHGILPAVIFRNLQAIIEKVRHKYPEAKLLLLGMEIPPPLGGVIANEFNFIYRRLAEFYQMAFVPFLLNGVIGQAHLNLWDKIHPSAEGYQIIAENIWPVLYSQITGYDPRNLQQGNKETS